MRWFKVGLAALCVVILGILLDYWLAIHGDLGVESARRVVIPGGVGARGVIAKLEEGGFCDRPTYLMFHLWWSGRGRQLKAGVYAVKPGMSLDDLVGAMAQGAVEKGGLTLREGVNLFELAAQLEAEGILDAKAFLEKATSRDLIQSLMGPRGEGLESFEGYLFPATYALMPGTPPDAVIEAMYEQYQKVWSKLTGAHGPALAGLKAAYGLSDHEVLTLASLVEKEAAVASERAVIARVFLNRLKRKQKLETDPTCVYPPLKLGEKPSPKRCRDPKSVYSTYVIEGLPPGPISSVGEASMEAVLYPYTGPAADKLLYFAARYDGTRKHYFSSDAAEHQQAVEHFLKKNPSVSAPSATPQP